MIQQIGQALPARAFFKTGKVGTTGLTVTVDVFDPAGTQVVTDGAATGIGDGLYTYTLSALNVLTAGEYTFVFKTATTTVNQQQLACSYSVGQTWVERIDATISSRAAAATALSTAQWTNARAALLDHLDADISSRAVAATALSNMQWTNARAVLIDHLDADISSRAAAATALSIAQWTNARAALIDHLDADISSRAAAATALSIAEWTNARAALLDNLDAAVSSRAAGATALSNVQWTNARAVLIDHLDADISSRLAAAGYAAPDNAGIAAIKAKTDNLPADPASNTEVDTRLATTGYTVPPTVEEISDGVWDEALSGHLAPGSTGANLAAAVAGGVDYDTLADAVWDEALAGHSVDGTAGKELADKLDADDYTAPDNAGIATLLARITFDRAALLDSLALLDVAVSTRMAAADYLAPDNAGIAELLDRLTDARAALLDNLSTLAALEEINDNIAALLALPDVALALSQRVAVPVLSDFTNLVAGDTVEIQRSLLTVPTGEALVKCWFTVKERRADPDEDALVQKIINDVFDPEQGQILDNGLDTGTGLVQFFLSPDEGLLIGTEYRHYDIQGLTDGAHLQTFYLGRIAMLAEVTDSRE